ncbi:MAG: phosphoribosylformylglycinamidine synthase, partial [Elusimicrobia bacterium CG_4_10_14_0_8_um_filter_37_32]
MKPKVCILRTAGTNCDKETYLAFELAGGNPEFVHINQFINNKNSLDNYQILAIPGGFSYGDDIAAGKILANELKYKIFDQMSRFANSGKLIIGICNGFQVLVKTGLLAEGATLTNNDSGKFECRWIYLKPGSSDKDSPIYKIWLRGIPEV